MYNEHYLPRKLAPVLIGASLSEPHTSELNGVFFTYIIAYGSTPYVGMTPKKMAATLKVHK